MMSSTRPAYRLVTSLILCFLVSCVTLGAQANDTLLVASTTPEANSYSIAAGTNVTVVFSEDSVSGTINTGTFSVTGSQSGIHSGSFSFSGDTVVFDPTNDFVAGEVVTVNLSNQIVASPAAGFAGYSFSFSVGGSAYPLPLYALRREPINANPLTPDFAIPVDLDGDGDIDLVTDITSSMKLAWYENITTSTYHTTAHLYGDTWTQHAVRSIAPVDIDQDGDMDIIAGVAPSTLRWYQNDGSENFSGSDLMIDSAIFGEKIVPADLDHDGDLDLVVLSGSAAKTVVWCEQKPGNVFEAHNIAAGHTSTDGLEVADFDRDGDWDIACLSSTSNSLYWLVNDDTAGFSYQNIPHSLSGVQNLWVADHDRDGWPDLMVEAANTVAIFTNNTDSTFTQATFDNTEIRDAAIADLAGDGTAELIISQLTSGLQPHLPNGGGGYNLDPNPYPTLFGSFLFDGIIPSDRDGDGLIDLAFFDSANASYGWIYPELAKAEASVSGGGNHIASGDASPTITDGTNFGITALNVPVTNDFTITNVGTDTLIITGAVTTSGTSFSVLSQPPTTILPPLASTEFTVQFNPTSVGGYTGSITIPNNDGDANETPYTFAINGSGADFMLISQSNVEPNSLYQNRADDLSFTLNFPPLPATVDTNTVAVNSKFLGTVEGTVAVSGSTITFDPTNDLLPGDEVNVVFSTGISETGGRQLAPQTIAFTVSGDLYQGSVSSWTEHTLSPNQTNFASPVPLDMDRDGDMDFLVSTNSTQGYIIWLENDGSANFSVDTIVSGIGNSPRIAVADLDCDGDMDLVVGQDSAYQVVVYENDGTQNFTPTIIESSLTAPFIDWGIATADINNDGKPDVVVSSSTNAILAWYQNFGGLSFSAVLVQPSVLVASDINTADIDGDGDADIVSRVGQTEMKWYENDGTGTFIPQSLLPVIDHATTIEYQLVDLNGDQYTDVLFREFSPIRLRALLNDGTGNFTTQWLDSVRIHDAIPADIDGDGDMDIILSRVTHNGVQGGLFWLNNTGGGTYADQIVQLQVGNPTGLRIADVDGDGLLDIVGVRDGDIKWWNATLLLSEIEVFGNSTHIVSGSTTTADSSGTDFGTVNTGTTVQRSFIIENTGAGILTINNPVTISGANASDFSVAVAPGDSVASGAFTSLVVSFTPSATGVRNATITINNNDVGEGTYTFAISGTGGTVATITSTTPVTNATAADQSANITFTVSSAVQGASVNSTNLFVTGDQSGSIAGAISVSGSTITFDPTTDFKAGENITAYLGHGITTMSSDTVQPHTIRFRAGSSPSLVELAYSEIEIGSGLQHHFIQPVDMDADGDLDVVASNNSNGNTYWYENNGSQSFTPHFISGPHGTTPAMHVADYDLDGDMDVLLSRSTSSFLLAINNDGSQNFSDSMLIPTPSPGGSIGDIEVIDADSDGDMDIVSAHSTGILRLWKNDGNQNYTVHTAGMYNSGSDAMRTADVNADGFIDIITGASSTNDVVWHMNDGAGNFGHVPVATLPATPYTPLEVFDMDTDGDLDFVVPSSTRAVFIHENNGNTAFGADTLLTLPQFTSTPQAVPTDLNGDGDVDLLCTTYLSLMLANNTGAGAFEQVPLLELETGSFKDPHAADLDGDGLLDILVLEDSYDFSTFMNTYRLIWLQADTANPEIALAFNGTDITSGDTTPELTDGTHFGAAALGDTIQQQFTIITSGLGHIALTSGVVITGVDAANFSVSEAPPAFILQDDTVTFTLQFVPTALGAFNASISIPNNDADENPFTFDILAYGADSMSVVSTSPAVNANAAARNANIVISFDDAIDAATVNGATVVVQSDIGPRVAGSLSVSGSQITFDPTSDFLPGEVINVTIAPQLLSLNSKVVPNGYGFEFRVQPDTLTIDSFVTHVAFAPNAAGFRHIHAGDFNGDGHNDLLTTDPGSGAFIALWMNDGNQNFTPQPVNVGVNAVEAIGADIDNDGDLDIVTSHGGEVHIYENDGNASFSDYEMGGSDNGWLDVGDFNNDGWLDIAITNGSNRLEWLENHGTLSSNSFTVHTIDEINASQYDVHSGDIDSDGDIDLAVTMRSSSNQVAWYENDGSGNFSYAQVTTNVNDARAVQLADIDNDGDVDLVSISDDDSRLAWYENDGSQNFTQHDIDLTLNKGYDCHVVDMNGDGNVDILRVAYLDPPTGSVWYHEGDGAGNFTKKLVADSLGKPRGVHAIDIDNDGVMEVVHGDFNTSNLYWHDPYQPAPPLGVASSTITDLDCNGNTTGAIDITVEGGQSPYTFVWSNAATTEDVTGLATGTYYVTITDSLSATAVDSFVVAEPQLLTVAIAITSPSCASINDGKLVPNPAGGTAPFSYVWNTASTADSLENIGEGPFSVTATDANGCVAQAAVTVTAPCKIPTGMVARFIQDTCVTFQWDTTCGAIAYRIYYRPVGTSTWVKVTKNGNKGQKKVLNLTPGTKYMWRIQAKCASTGWSNLSASEFFTSLDAPCRIPDGLDTSPLRHNMARANWNQQPGAWKYRIRWREVGGSWLTILQDSVNAKYWMTGLTAATQYEWQIKTLCDPKDSTSGTKWSASQLFTTSPTPKWGEDQLQTGEEAAALVQLYPNPSRSRTINFGIDAGITQTYDLTVLNSMGAIVTRKRVSTGNGQLIQLDLAGQSAGIYWVRVTGPGLIYTEKLVLK